MNDDKLLKKTYAGVVEDNDDPKRLGRVKVRVFEVYHDIPTDDIPWASPWKDLNGEKFILPEKGKVVTVVFENGSLYKPEYIYSEHYNINLENKLNALSSDDYNSMKSLLFNHKTQIYVNEGEGLMLDHKFNNLNIKEDTININLKDNFGKVNVGDESANQEAILGTNFLGWFDEFVDILLGSKGGPFLGNLAAPVLATPGLMESLFKYKALKQPKFLSKNVFFNDNFDISTVRQNQSNRENDTQIGDDFQTTSEDKNLKTFEPAPYVPVYGTGEETPEPTNGDDGLSTGDGDNPGTENIEEIVGEAHPDIEKIFNTMKAKNYKIETKANYINIIGVRNQYEGQKYSNTFKDKMWAIWKNDAGQWESKNWPVSTIPGVNRFKLDDGSRTTFKKWCSLKRKKGIGIMVPAQYLNVYTFYEPTSKGKYSIKSHPFFHNDGRKQKAYRDKAFDTDKITFSNKENVDVGSHGMLIHRGFPSGSGVNNWSEGCQVFNKQNDLNQLANLARNHVKKNGNRFHYTLITGVDIEEANK